MRLRQLLPTAHTFLLHLSTNINLLFSDYMIITGCVSTFMELVRNRKVHETLMLFEVVSYAMRHQAIMNHTKPNFMRNSIVF